MDRCITEPAVRFGEMEMARYQVNEESVEPPRRKPDGKATGRANDMLYALDDVPPWYVCILMGLQQYLTAFSAILAVPLILAPHFCMDKDYVGIGELISTNFFVSGICTVLQTVIGCRLPIVQGGSFSFLLPGIVILSLPKWCCPFTDQNRCNLNETDIPEVGSEDHRTVWKARMAEIQGALMVAALFQVIIGFSGLIGFLLRFIGPLAIVPTVSLIGLALFESAAAESAGFWWVAVLTMLLITLFSQYLSNVKVPYPAYRKGKGWEWGYSNFLKLFPVLLGMCLSWLVCYILTVTNALTSDPDGWGYQARTDSRIAVLNNAAWFYFPYPGQWGVPTVSTAGVFGMLAGIMASVVESIGDYYACARLSGALPPPDHAINRGIGVEGIGCILSGAWGTGVGTTSYSHNIGVISITKVGSRRVIQITGLIMMVLACLGKFGALFVTVPPPIIGGMFMVMFGMVAAVGLSNLQFVDLNSSRNLFILGFSIFFGLSLPSWMNKNPDAIKTGSEIADQILTVLCSTGMFVGGFSGCFLDNTIPGTDEERGIINWRQTDPLEAEAEVQEDQMSTDSTYDFPFVQEYVNRLRWTRYVPFCPAFGKRKKQDLGDEKEDKGQKVNEGASFDE